MRRTRTRKLSRALAPAVVAQLLVLAVSGCGLPATECCSTSTAIVTTSEVGSTVSEVTSTVTTGSTPVYPTANALLGELREIAANSAFTVYYLGAECHGAPIVRVSANRESEHLRVSIGYREPRQGGVLIVNLWEYDSEEIPEHEKPYADWDLVSGVDLDGRTDRIYRGPSAADILYFVTQRESTEVVFMGFTDTAGYMSEERLAEIAGLLIPVL